MDEGIPKLQNLFKHIKKAHSSKVRYTFNFIAQLDFIAVHDGRSSRKLTIIDDEDRRGVLSKAKGQFARFAMIIHCLEEAIEADANEEHMWSFEITELSTKQRKNGA